MLRNRIEEPVTTTLDIHRNTAAVWVRYGIEKTIMDMTYNQFMASGTTLFGQHQKVADTRQQLRDEENVLHANQLTTQSDIRLVHGALEAKEGPLSPFVQDLPPLSDHHGEGSGSGGGATPVTG